MRAPMVSYRHLLRRYSVVLLLLGLCLIFALIIPRFFQARNLLNIVLQSSITAVAALGLTLPILAGGIDLSVGSMAALAGAVSAGLMTRSGWSATSAIAVALLIGVVSGILIAVLIAGGKLPPFVASLSMLAVGRGLTLVYTEGRPISGLPENYIVLGSGSIGPIPLPVLFLLGLTIVFHLLLSRTRFGHHIYAIGGNADTARQAGISVNWVTISVYAISGLMAAFSGILLSARLWSAQPTAGVGLELEAIAAVVLGGTSLAGGYGGAWGSVVGALIMGVIGNGLNLLRIPSYIQQVIRGLILIVAVMIDLRSRKINKP